MVIMGARKQCRDCHEPRSRYAAWMGGAVLSKVVFQGGHAIGKFDYDEVGPGVVHRKCC